MARIETVQVAIQSMSLRDLQQDGGIQICCCPDQKGLDNALGHYLQAALSSALHGKSYLMTLAGRYRHQRGIGRYPCGTDVDCLWPDALTCYQRGGSAGLWLFFSVVVNRVYCIAPHA